MSQAQGSEARVVLQYEQSYGANSLVIDNCEDAWNELVDADVTASLDLTDYRVGSGSVKFVAVAGLGAGDIIATEVISVASLALYTHIGMWIKSTVALDANDLQLLLDDTAQCASPLESLNIPAVSANVWTHVKMELANPESDLLLISIGLKQIVDKGAMSVWLDDIEAITQEGKVVHFVSEDVSLKRNLISSRTLRSDRNPLEPVRGNKDVGGPLEIELDGFIERLLYLAFGDVDTTPGEGIYTHEFTIGSLPSFGYEKGFTDISKYFLYNGCKISSMAIDCPQEGFISGRFEIMGKKETTGSSSVDASAVENTFAPFDAFGAEIQRGGSAIAIVTAINFTLDNSLDGSNYVIDRSNPGERYALPARKASVKGTLTAIFEDTTLYDLAIANTETALSLELMRGTGAGTAGNEKLTFYMDEIKFQPKSPGIRGDQGILIELGFEAYYSDDADVSAIRAVLINTEDVV